jgi:hypothetical protein
MLDNIIEKLKNLVKSAREKLAEGGAEDEEIVLSLNKYAIFFIIGYFFQILSKAHFGDGLPIPPDWRDGINDIFTAIGTGVMFWPMWWAIIRGGFMAAFMAIPAMSVTVTTTYYSDGSKTVTSDRDMAEAAGIILKVVRFCLGYVVAAIATLGILAFQLFTFVTRFKQVKNRVPYAVTLLAIFVFLGFGSTIAMALAPLVDSEHFNPKEIVKVTEAAEKTLYAGNFSIAITTHYVKKERDKHSLIANITYTKDSDTTVIEIKPGRSAQTYLKEFDKGKNTILFGTYTFKGNVLANSEISSESGSRKMSEKGNAAVTNLLPANFIFKRLVDDKKKLRIVNLDHVNIDWDLSIRHPKGTDKKKWVSVAFIKTGDGGYKMDYVSLTPYDAKITYQ